MALRDSLLNGINRVFSRKMLGSVLVGAATTKVLDYAVIAGTTAVIAKLLTWGLLWVLFVVLFIYWARIEEISDDILAEIGAKPA